MSFFSKEAQLLVNCEMFCFYHGKTSTTWKSSKNTNEKWHFASKKSLRTEKDIKNGEILNLFCPMDNKKSKISIIFLFMQCSASAFWLNNQTLLSLWHGIEIFYLWEQRKYCLVLVMENLFISLDTGATQTRETWILLVPSGNNWRISLYLITANRSFLLLNTSAGAL